MGLKRRQHKCRCKWIGPYTYAMCPPCWDRAIGHKLPKTKEMVKK